MDDYPSNSHKDEGKLERPTKIEKTNKKKVERVVVGDVKRRKKPLGKRVVEVFIGGNANNVWSYVAFDVLIPAAKEMVSEAVSQGIERMLFGDSSSRRGGRSRGASPGYVSYNRFSNSTPPWKRDEPRPQPSMSKRGRATHNFDEIILATRVEAEEVIDRLFDLISRYETATVSDLYEMVGVSGDFTDEKWGWTDLRGADVTRIRGGYLLDLPRPEPLD